MRGYDWGKRTLIFIIYLVIFSDQQWLAMWYVQETATLAPEARWEHEEYTNVCGHTHVEKKIKQGKKLFVFAITLLQAVDNAYTST